MRPAAISSAHPDSSPAALPDNSRALVRVPNTQRVLDLQDLVDRVVRPVDVPDLELAPASVLRGPAALAARDLLAALRPPAKHHARSAHRRIALAAADNSIQRRRKAQ